MLLKTIIPVFSLICVSRVSARPQMTTILPFDVADGFDGDSDTSIEIFGQIAGTGADGTTYVLSVPVTATESDDDDLPFTLTVVENASQAIGFLSISQEGDIEVESVGCALNGGSAVCTDEFIEATGTFVSTDIETTSGTADALTAIISTGSASAGSGPTSVAPGATSAASGPSSNAPKATAPTSLTLGPQSTAGSGSGASSTQSTTSAGQSVASVGMLALVLPLILVAVSVA